MLTKYFQVETVSESWIQERLIVFSSVNASKYYVVFNRISILYFNREVVVRVAPWKKIWQGNLLICQWPILMKFGIYIQGDTNWVYQTLNSHNSLFTNNTMVLFGTYTEEMLNFIFAVISVLYSKIQCFKYINKIFCVCLWTEWITNMTLQCYSAQYI